MSSIYVMLLLILFQGQIVPVTAEFNTLPACWAAVTEILTPLERDWPVLETQSFCVNKGTVEYDPNK